MALQNGFPGHTALASFADLRRDLEGTVARSATGVLRAGLFPGSATQLVTGRADMKVNIADFRAVQNRGGAIFLANVGVDSSVTLDAAPASNKRIDLVYVYQQSVTLGDAASTPVFGVVKGTASATPTVPPLPAGVSTAIPLATVEIPAGATTTLSAGVTFTQVYPYTAMTGGTVTVRSSAELTAWTPADGATAVNISDGSKYLRKGGAWLWNPSNVELAYVSGTASVAANVVFLQASVSGLPEGTVVEVIVPSFGIGAGTVGTPSTCYIAYTTDGSAVTSASARLNGRTFRSSAHPSGGFVIGLPTMIGKLVIPASGKANFGVVATNGSVYGADGYSLQVKWAG